MGPVQLVPVCTGLYRPVCFDNIETGTNRYKSVQVVPAPWNQEPRTKIAGQDLPAILVLGSWFQGWGPAQLVPICTGLYRSLRVQDEHIDKQLDIDKE